MKIWNKFSLLSSLRSLAIATLALTGGIGDEAFASGGGECHFHGSKPAAEATVVKCADQQKERLVKKGTIEGTWSSIQHSSIEQVDVKNGKKEWKLTFKNSAAKDKAKETLYMFFSIPGNFLATNFTGK